MSLVNQRVIQAGRRNLAVANMEKTAATCARINTVAELLSRDMSRKEIAAHLRVASRSIDRDYAAIVNELGWQASKQKAQ